MGKFKAITSVFTPPKPKPPLPPPSIDKGKAVDARKKEEETKQSKRRGRKASIITGAAGVGDELGVTRPGAQKLGG